MKNYKASHQFKIILKYCLGRIIKSLKSAAFVELICSMTTILMSMKLIIVFETKQNKNKKIIVDFQCVEFFLFILSLNQYHIHTKQLKSRSPVFDFWGFWKYNLLAVLLGWLDHYVWKSMGPMLQPVFGQMKSFNIPAGSHANGRHGVLWNKI